MQITSKEPWCKFTCSHGSLREFTSSVLVWSEMRSAQSNRAGEAYLQSIVCILPYLLQCFFAQAHKESSHSSFFTGAEGA